MLWFSFSEILLHSNGWSESPLMRYPQTLLVWDILCWGMCYIDLVSAIWGFFNFCMHICIYIYIQLPCGSAPATVPVMSPNRHKLSGTGIANHVKIAKLDAQEVLGSFWRPGAPQRCPRDARRRKRVENGLRDPPQGPSWEAKFKHFIDFVGLFSIVFLSVVLEGLRVQF